MKTWRVQVGRVRFIRKISFLERNAHQRNLDINNLCYEVLTIILFSPEISSSSYVTGI